MRILISAGIHDNPVHRKRLRGWLTDQGKKRGVPKFVGVEANRTLFQAVIQHQRQAFVSLARKDEILKGIDPVLIKKLSLAIAYEADTHADVFQEQTQILWLDDVRPDLATVNDPCNTARRYLDRCRSAVTRAGLEITPYLREHQLFEAVDAFIIHEAEEEARKTPPVSKGTSERDRAWMKMLESVLFTKEGTGYGIAIVGENHAKDEPDYLMHLLTNSGHNCEVKLVSNEPQPVT